MDKVRSSSTVSLALLAMLVIGLYLTNLYSYLLFHSLAELFSIIIGGTLFVIAWNSRGFSRQHFDFLTFIGIGYLFISILDLLHTLSFKGMSIFTGYDYFANQFWVGARFLEAFSLLVPFLYLRRDRPLRAYRVLGAYSLVTTVLIASILHFRVFPVAYVEGLGQTDFKVASEITIIFLLAAAAILMHQNRGNLAPAIYRKLLLSVLFTILSELAFTVYVDNYDILNMLGHIFKIVSFYLIYQAIVITCITEPYESIFKALTDKEEMLRQAAMTDELTGLYNRHFLDTISAEVMERSDRYGEPLSMAIIDLDHFKRVNDTWGHPAGDEVLRCVARTMSQTVRASDTLVRFGGEEFAVLMPRTDLNGARLAGEKLRCAIGSTRLPISGNHTASIGVAERLPAESFRSWYKRADVAMYQAKQAGRNQVVAAAEPEGMVGLAPAALEWRPEWASGDPETDRQHQDLLVQANRLLRRATAAGDMDRDLLSLLDALLESFARHFKGEGDQARIAAVTGGPDRTAVPGGNSPAAPGGDAPGRDGRALRYREALASGSIQLPALLSFIFDELILDHLAGFHGVMQRCSDPENAECLSSEALPDA